MNLETIQIPAFITMLFTIAALFVVPLKALALSRIAAPVLAKSSESKDGAACDLPPTVQVDSTVDSRRNDGAPPMDQRAVEKYKTATFAMG